MTYIGHYVTGHSAIVISDTEIQLTNITTPENVLLAFVQ